MHKDRLRYPAGFAVRQLGKCHTEILVEAGKSLDLEVAIVASNTLMKDMLITKAVGRISVIQNNVRGIVRGIVSSCML